MDAAAHASESTAVSRSMTSHAVSPETPGTPRFTFSWYHREEIQVLVVFLVLIIFFSRSLHVTLFLLGVITVSLGGLYAVRFLSILLHRQELFRNLIIQYHQFRLALGRESVHRSRVAMALLSALVIGVLGAHRITLATQTAYYASPTDVYWILFLCWYFVVCSVIAGYVLWIWGRVWENPQVQTPLLDGLVASFFFYHGLSREHRMVTFIAGFLLGGAPSFVATRISPDDPNGYRIACALIVPVMALTVGGAYYAMRHLTPPAPEPDR
jgi:hypothetical protein